MAKNEGNTFGWIAEDASGSVRISGVQATDSSRALLQIEIGHEKLTLSKADWKELKGIGDEILASNK